MGGDSIEPPSPLSSFLIIIIYSRRIGAAVRIGGRGGANMGPPVNPPFFPPQTGGKQKGGGWFHPPLGGGGKNIYILHITYIIYISILEGGGDRKEGRGPA